MQEEKLKVYPIPVTPDTPFPNTAVLAVTPVSVLSNPNQVYEVPSVPDTPFPQKVVANELISQNLDTQSKKILGTFSFTEFGGLQVGNFVSGTSGDIKISPNGIVARNSAGDTTFAIDGTTGNATFKGSVSAGSVIAGAVNVGNGNVVIDGANKRIIINDGVTDRVLIGYQLNGF